MATNEDPGRGLIWANEIKKIQLENPNLKRLNIEQFDWRLLKCMINHQCDQANLQNDGHTLHQGNFKKGQDRPLLTSNFRCKNCNFNEKVTLKASGEIEIKSLLNPVDESPLATVTSGTDTSNTVLNSKSSKGKNCFYTVKVDSKPIKQRECPFKHWENKKKIEEVKKKFDDVDMEERKREFDAKTKDAKKAICRKLFSTNSHQVPACLEELGILHEIKRISGCEISLRYSTATMKSFDEVEEDEWLATFSCFCRNGKCGVKAITITCFAKKAELRFEPSIATDDVEFHVDHLPGKGVLPRQVTTTESFFAFYSILLILYPNDFFFYVNILAIIFSYQIIITRYSFS